MTGGQDRRSHGRREAPLVDVSSPARRADHRHRSRTCLNGAAREPGRLVLGVSPASPTPPVDAPAPQVAGAARNINYLIDGGDNNDDTVGGSELPAGLDRRVQLDPALPRDTAAPTAAPSRSSPRAHLTTAWSSNFRDKSLNGRATPKRSITLEGYYKKAKPGASLGGLIIKDKTHFGAFERVQQTRPAP